MPRTSPFVLAALTALAVAAPRASAAPTLRAGLLSPPSRAPAAEIAARFLAAHPVGAELDPGEVTPLGQGAVVRYRQRYHGLPVLGGSYVVRVDERGRVRRVASSLFQLGGVDVQPAVSAGRAIAAARARGAIGNGDGQAVLAVAPAAVGGARLVYAVRLPPTPALLENAIYFVDAHDGRVLKRLDLLKYGGLARVFQKNPVEANQATVTVPFPDPFTPTGTTLTSTLLQGFDCVDQGEMKTVNMGGFMATVHICSVTQEATGAGQDFTAYMPASEPWTAPLTGCAGAPYMSGGTTMNQPLDAFSEQHMYWHVANSYAFFRSLFSVLGNNDFQLRITAQMAKPLPVAVNLCTIDLTSSSLDFSGPLVPFDNAFFSPGAGNPLSELLIGGQDSIMFGQGSVADFAYDADVITHEFTHAVIDTLGKLATPGFEDAQGLTDDPGAMNEGLADYFSSALGGDPLVGEYGGKNVPGNMTAEGAVRDLTNKDQCADDRWGEVHQDSQAFSAALWGARVAVAGDPKAAGFDAAKARTFDVAVLAAIQSFPDQVDMPTAAAAIAGEVEMRLDAAARKAVESSFAAHALFPSCARVITWSGTNKKDVLFLDGVGAQNAPMGATKVPGYVQWKVDVPPDADSITATVTLQSQGGGLLGGTSAPALELAAGPSGMPIAWTAGTDSGNQARSVAFSGTTGTVTATLTQLPPGPQYVMILNGGGSIIGRNISFATDCSLGAGNCIPPDMAMGGGKSGGCSCTLGGRAPAGGPYLLLAALGALALLTRAARRRSR